MLVIRTEREQQPSFLECFFLAWMRSLAKKYEETGCAMRYDDESFAPPFRTRMLCNLIVPTRTEKWIGKSVKLPVCLALKDYRNFFGRTIVDRRLHKN